MQLSRAVGAWALVERSGWLDIGPRRRVMAAGGRLEDVSEAPIPVPAIRLPVLGSGGGDCRLGATQSRSGSTIKDAGCGVTRRAGTADPGSVFLYDRRDAAGWARGGTLQSETHVQCASLVPEMGASRDARWPDPSFLGKTDRPDLHARVTRLPWALLRWLESTRDLK